jgi:uncharacterized membrane protein YbaN (DUF454 family)
MTATPTPSSTSAEARTLAVEGARRLVYLTLAAIFFALAVLGALLPVLPTTPFLLLTSFLLVRSSPALNDRLLRSQTFGPLLEDWHRHRGVRPRVKAISIGCSLAAVTVSAIYGNLSPLGLALLAAIAVTGLVVLIRLPVIRADGAGKASHPGFEPRGIEPDTPR